MTGDRIGLGQPFLWNSYTPPLAAVSNTYTAIDNCGFGLA
jgi:hypothetical protein